MGYMGKDLFYYIYKYYYDIYGVYNGMYNI